MKRKTCFATLTALMMITGLTGCSSQTSGSKAALTTQGTASGYNGELTVEVDTKNGNITDVRLISDNDSPVISKRAFTVLKKRIMEAQTPVIDSVSGATFTSYGVKSAVAQALKEAGTDVGEITLTTTGPEVEEKELEDVKTQVVIVGGGPAGLSAAIEAKEAGVENVLVIEKLDILSGNGKFDLNFYDMIDSQAQKMRGITDTVEDFYTSLKEGGAFDSDERLLAQAEGAATVDQWLRSFGATLNYNYGLRDHMAESNKYAGEVIQEKMEQKVNDLGIEVRTGTKGLDLIYDNDTVVGVSAETKEGNFNIYADAVIMATGGFSTNKELLEEYAPGNEVLGTTNQMGTTGDFISVFKDNNIQLANMDAIRVFKATVSGKRDVTNSSVDGYLYVNKNGERFIDETKGGLEMGTAIQAQEGGIAYYIYDQNVLDLAYNLRKQESFGYAVKADTLEELANELGMDPETLTNTVKTYNEAVLGETEDPFRATTCERTFKEDGPYYAFRVEAAVHQTKGGVVANENAQVLDNDNKAVTGLYAAGEVTSCSGAYSASVIFGRISGQEAASFVLNK